MSWNGMLQKHGCRSCGKSLNADGNHPAELYAGTYTGLCYECTGKAAFCFDTEEVDGAQHWDHPPCCPSHRRDRTHHIGYPDCEKCNGKGAYMVSRCDGAGGSYLSYCEDCCARYNNHPHRKRIADTARRIVRASRNALIKHLIDKRYASRRKRRNRDDGKKLKDHLGKTIWIYCSDQMLEWQKAIYAARQQRLVDAMTRAGRL